MSLELAENYKIIDNKESYIKKLKTNNFKYVRNFHSNYTTTGKSISSTYLSMATQPKTRSRDNFFPNSLLDDNYDYNFFDILKTKKIFWLGNSWGMCLPNEYVKCFYQASFINYIQKPRTFYLNSIYSYAFDLYFKK